MFIESCGVDRVVMAIRNIDLKITDPVAYQAEVELANAMVRYIKKTTLELVSID